MDRPDHLGQPMMRVAAMTLADAEAWAAMREALWPNGGDHGTHEEDVARLLAEPGDTVNLIARNESGKPAGFAEASLRHDYVNGCDTSPVAFLEGIYVVPAMRGQGVARALVAAVQAWAQAQGCSELASDAALDNLGSQQMHKALGFAETQRVVYFRKMLD
ncbi:aminoglycoside 6'-N-acetyltransferase [Devosia ginsengisoli]|uniref:aminoglycoside 6'-N-acetyltransferase n=1 Tax=Devosia ginsengisoli TaxID=400770 RepID=UPI0026F0E3B3|nr:aminoglycoside 6'-N-acetyltransferase [Devosia ginsengisoli]MCR6670381.1 GNAT family N-acetyltransferase [Devosia ginsengisoli]